MNATRRVMADPDAGTGKVAEMLRSWLNADLKSDVLKQAQGHVCHTGFLSGDLRGRFFSDVRPALCSWIAAGLTVYIYSSGSLLNQRDWFAFAEGGSLAPSITDHFDLTTVGSKAAAGSYCTISRIIGVSARETLFLTDAPDESAAAAAAGWAVTGVARAGEPVSPAPPWRWIGSFDELVDLDPVPMGSP